MEAEIFQDTFYDTQTFSRSHRYVRAAHKWELGITGVLEQRSHITSRITPVHPKNPVKSYKFAAGVRWFLVNW